MIAPGCYLYGCRIGNRLSRKKFVKLLMKAGIRRNDANAIAVKARGTGMSYATYLRQLEETRLAGVSSVPFYYSVRNIDIDWSVING